METSALLIWLFGAATTIFGIGWGITTHFSNRKYAEQVRLKTQERSDIDTKIKEAIVTGERMINACDLKINQSQTFMTSRIEVLEKNVDELERENKTIRSQLMTETKVDSKLKPIIEEVDEVKTNIRDLREEVRNHAHMTEINIQKLLAGMSKIEGYLQAKSENKIT